MKNLMSSYKLRNSYTFLLLCLITITNTSCSYYGVGPKEFAVGAIGAVGGGAVGYSLGTTTVTKVVFTGIGAAAGWWLGSSIGEHLDDFDRKEHEKVALYALEHHPNNQPAEWKDPNTGNGGSFTPTSRDINEKGIVCRNFTQSIMVNGKKNTATNRTCKKEDGSWIIINA